MANTTPGEGDLLRSRFDMKRRFSKILLPAIACFLIENAAVGASERVRLFVKEVPLKVLGKEVTVIAIEQADGTHGYSPEKNDGFHVEVVNQLESANEHSLARAHFTKSHGRRSVRNPESDRARQIVSL